MNPYDAAWRKVRPAILERDGYRCQIGWPGCTITATSVDHVVALHRGGARLDPANLRAACVRCNSAKGNREREPLSQRWC